MNSISSEEEGWVLIIRMTFIFSIPAQRIYALSMILKEFRQNNVLFISKNIFYNFKALFVMGTKLFSMEVSIQKMFSMIIMFTTLPTKLGHPVNQRVKFLLLGKNHL